MSLNRYNARRDANEPAVVKALQQVGAQVIRLDDWDLLVLYRRRLFMLDVKMPSGKPTLTQERLLRDGWPLTFVETPDAALRAIGAIL